MHKSKTTQTMPENNNKRKSSTPTPMMPLYSRSQNEIKLTPDEIRTFGYCDTDSSVTIRHGNVNYSPPDTRMGERRNRISAAAAANRDVLVINLDVIEPYISSNDNSPDIKSHDIEQLAPLIVSEV